MIHHRCPLRSPRSLHPPTTSHRNPSPSSNQGRLRWGNLEWGFGSAAIGAILSELGGLLASAMEAYWHELLRPINRCDSRAPVAAGDWARPQPGDAAELGDPPRHGGTLVFEPGAPLDQGRDRGDRPPRLRLQTKPGLLPIPRARGLGVAAGGAGSGAPGAAADRGHQTRRSQFVVGDGPLPV